MRATAWCLLFLLTMPAWSQQSSEEKPEWPICFDALSWADLEKQIQLEVEWTAREAVEAAIAPYLVVEADLRAELAKSVRREKIYRVGMWTAVGLACGSMVLYLIERLTPDP